MALAGVILMLFLLGAAGPRAGGAPLSLPFVSLVAGNTNSLTNYASAASSLPMYSMTTTGSLVFRGAFTPGSLNTRVAIHSDDGSSLFINGAEVALPGMSEGTATHWESLASSLRTASYTFNEITEYCIQINYKNNQHTNNDVDGVSLIAFDGGGSVRDGIAVWGNEKTVCVGGFITLNACGEGAINWTSSDPGVATVSSPGGSASVTGVSGGSVTITATDSLGKTGSRTVKVIQLGLTPDWFTTCAGVANAVTLTNAEITGGVTWNPPGNPPATGPSASLSFSSPGENYFSASWNGCVVRGTGVVIVASTLTANSNALCGGGQIIYTATTSPAGYENYLVWSGQGLTGVGSKRTNTYSTPGLKTVTVTCGTSTLSKNITVHKVAITNSPQYGLAGSLTPVNFYLSSDSVGPFSWEAAPAGVAVSGSGLTGSAVPGNTAGTYTIKAFATPLPGCFDTGTLQVVQVTFSQNPIVLCVSSAANIPFTVNPPSALSLLSFDTVTNTSYAGVNQMAFVSPYGTNLTVQGLVAGDAYVRVKMNGAVLLIPLQIVRVTFPSDPWYVGVGKSADFTATIIPAGAPVTFDTASNSIATA